MAGLNFPSLHTSCLAVAKIMYVLLLLVEMGSGLWVHGALPTPTSFGRASEYHRDIAKAEFCMDAICS